MLYTVLQTTSTAGLSDTPNDVLIQFVGESGTTVERTLSAGFAVGEVSTKLLPYPDDIGPIKLLRLRNVGTDVRREARPLAASHGCRAQGWNLAALRVTYEHGVWDLVASRGMDNSVWEEFATGRVTRVAGWNGNGFADGDMSLAVFGALQGIAVDTSSPDRAVFVSDTVRTPRALSSSSVLLRQTIGFGAS